MRTGDRLLRVLDFMPGVLTFVVMFAVVAAETDWRVWQVLLMAIALSIVAMGITDLKGRLTGRPSLRWRKKDRGDWQ